MNLEVILISILIAMPFPLPIFFLIRKVLKDMSQVVALTEGI